MMRWLGFIGVAAASEVTPTQKVVQMLQSMTDKAKKEKHEEEVQFATYKQFCSDEIENTGRNIESAEGQMDKLGADIEKAHTDAQRLGREVADHEKQVATATADQEAATKVRNTEHADYQATHQDYSESIDALKRAIAVLKQQTFDRKQAKSLLQSLDALIPPSEKAKVTAFLEQDGDNKAAAAFVQQAPEANAYEFQSGGVIDMLEKLVTKFRDEKTDLEKKESNDRHAYKMLMQDLTSQIANDKDASSSKSQLRGKKMQTKAANEGELTDTKATHASDTKYLSDMKGTCSAKASDFEDRQKLRAEEIQALNKAVEILSGASVAGAAEKHLPTLMQQKPVSLIALKSQLKQLGDADSRREAVLDYLQIQANKLNSQILSTLSVHAGADPFDKVKKLINDLITRLLEEANEEAEHHGWCEKELAANGATRKEKSEKVTSLHSEIDGLEASIAKLTEELADLQDEIAKTDKAVAEAVKIRNGEKEKNETTIKEAQEAQVAVAQALQVLKDFYAKAGQATAFVQQRPASPEIFDKPYTGVGGEGGVVGMIEVIQSDFARLEAETQASEAASDREHSSFMQDSAVRKAQMSKDVEHKDMKKQNNQQALQEKKSDLEGTEKELKAANDYFDKLKPSCINTGVSHEERVAKREEEVQSLREALKILNGESV